MVVIFIGVAFLIGVIAAPALFSDNSIWLTGTIGGLVAVFAMLGLAVGWPAFRAAGEKLLARLPRAAGLHASQLPDYLGVTLPALIVLAFFLGGTRYHASQPPWGSPEFIATYNDSETWYTVTGVIAEPPDERDSYTNLWIEAQVIRERSGIKRIPVSGLILARVDRADKWQYGDKVTVTGRLQTPPAAEGFSYQDYLARKGIYTLMPFANATFLEAGHGGRFYTPVFALRGQAFTAIHQLFPDPEASLLAGILLGIDTGLPEDLKDAFRDTGTAHIIAISGFNIAIIAGIFLRLFSRLLGGKAGGAVAILAITVYTAFVGADAAVVRAAIMGTLAILVRQNRDLAAGITTLLVTAAGMAFVNPLILGDAGFQLSFAAALGLILYTDPLSKSVRRFLSSYLPISALDKFMPPFTEFVLVTVAAQLTTLPIIIYHFQRISLVSFLANPVILPAQPAVMILGGIAVLLGMLSLPLGRLSAYLSWPFVAFTIRMVEWADKAPLGVIVLGKVTVPVVIILFILLFGVTLAGKTPARPNRTMNLPQKLVSTSLVLAVLISVAVWQAALSAPDGKLHITFLDVGMGDAILIETPSGRRLLIDGGQSVTRLSEALGRRIPMGQRTLDWLVVASPADEYIAALPDVLERFPAQNVLWAGLPNPSRSARYLQEFLLDGQIEVVKAEAGHILDLGEGAVLKVLAVTPRGGVFLLEWGSFRGLLPVGLDFDVMEALGMGAELGPLSVLLLPESGYAPLTPPEWLVNLSPQLSVISVEAGNRDGLPSPELLEAMKDYPLLRTDKHGWIKASTDGEKMWVEVER